MTRRGRRFWPRIASTGYAPRRAPLFPSRAQDARCGQMRQIPCAPFGYGRRVPATRLERGRVPTRKYPARDTAGSWLVLGGLEGGELGVLAPDGPQLRLAAPLHHLPLRQDLDPARLADR